MLDENERIVKPKRITKSQKEFLSDFLQRKQDDFEESMEELRLGNPRRWVECYIEMTKIVTPKQSNVNVNVGINKDFRDLHLLATTRVTQKKVDGEIVEKLEKMGPIEDVDYEDIPKGQSYADDNMMEV